jgi:hypothetical protein
MGISARTLAAERLRDHSRARRPLFDQGSERIWRIQARRASDAENAQSSKIFFWRVAMCVPPSQVFHSSQRLTLKLLLTLEILARQRIFPPANAPPRAERDRRAGIGHPIRPDDPEPTELKCENPAAGRIFTWKRSEIRG